MMLRLLTATALLCGCATAGNDSSDSGTGTDPADGSIRVDSSTVSYVDADTCPGDPCQLAPQCGCPGGACDLDLDNLDTGGTACRDVTSPGKELANCDSMAGCAAGYACLSRQCRKYCNGTVTCDSDEHCILPPTYTNDQGQQTPIPGAMVCTKSCDPVAQSDNGCPSSPQYGCHLRREDPDQMPDNGDEFYHTDCTGAPSTGGGNDADCSLDAPIPGDPGCRAGYECVFYLDASVCKQLCVCNVDPTGSEGACDDAGPCEGGRACLQFADPKPVIGNIEYGVCL